MLIDDVRPFRDDRPYCVARSSATGVALLSELRETLLDDLWLDHDRGGNDTIWPVIRLLEEAQLAREPFVSARCMCTPPAASRPTRCSSASAAPTTRPSSCSL